MWSLSRYIADEMDITEYSVNKIPSQPIYIFILLQIRPCFISKWLHMLVNRSYICVPPLAN